jgi:hypothetical protein
MNPPQPGTKSYERTFGKSKAITLEVQKSPVFMAFVSEFISGLDAPHEEKVVAIDRLKHSDGGIGSSVFNVLFEIMRKQPHIPQMSGNWAKYYDSWYAEFLNKWTTYKLLVNDKDLVGVLSI